MTQQGPSRIPKRMTKYAAIQTSADKIEQTRAFSNNLGETLAHAWRLLERGTADRRSPFHTPTVATVAPDGSPEARTVVLRKVVAPERTVRFHTDTRSGKVAALAGNPRLSLHGYDPASKIQIRLSGNARVHRGDEIARLAWGQSKSMSLMCYRQALAPGAAVEAPLKAPGTAAETYGPDDGFENFAAVVLQVTTLDWLYLASSGHQRASFTWDAEGQLSHTWSAP
jgi:pyridoxamine 5'-phosphate oxidase